MQIVAKISFIDIEYCKLRSELLASITIASVCSPCTLISILTFVSCVRRLLSPASLNTTNKSPNRN